MPVDLWSSDEFVAGAREWVAAALAPGGARLTGEWEQPHCRPWSSAIRFETTAGRVWFKVNGPGTRAEALLTAALDEVAPGLVPTVLAVDAERGWSLLRDAGPVLRTVADPDGLWPRWEGLVARYAEDQLALAGHREHLLTAGVRHLGPARLPEVAQDLVRRLGELPPEEGGLTGEEAARLAHKLPEYAGWCADLAATGIPDTIQHDDLHSSNICWDEARARPERIIDWGDAILGHPFGTMLATLNSIAFHARTEVADPRVERVRDAYLEPFSGFGPRADLVRSVGLARRTGAVTRALSYVAAFEGEPLSAEAAEDFPVRGWLLELLED